MVPYLVVGLFAVLAAWLVNQAPSVSGPLEDLARRVPGLREKPVAARFALSVLLVAVAAGMVSVVEYVMSNRGSAEPQGASRTGRVIEYSLPPLLPGSDDGLSLSVPGAAEHLRRSGLLGNGFLLASRRYRFCEPVRSNTNVCRQHDFLVVNDFQRDLAKLEGVYFPATYSAGDVTCSGARHTAEVLCQRPLGHATTLIARFDLDTGVGDMPTGLGSNSLLVKRYLELLDDVVSALEPTGRYVDVSPRVVPFSGGSVELTIRAAGMQPGEFVDIEYGDVHEDRGGICPSIVDGPCTLLAKTGGRSTSGGVIEDVFRWEPCASWRETDEPERLVGRYPVWLRGRDSGISLATFYEVTVTADERPAC